MRLGDAFRLWGVALLALASAIALAGPYTPAWVGPGQATMTAANEDGWYLTFALCPAGYTMSQPSSSSCATFGDKPGTGGMLDTHCPTAVCFVWLRANGAAPALIDVAAWEAAQAASGAASAASSPASSASSSSSGWTAEQVSEALLIWKVIAAALTLFMGFHGYSVGLRS